ncbi:hypothetical protein THF1D04_60163 [Vibrio owensii]|uniref:Uncharacterized protein n=1 Tax=Vibrio owensii TaxID=696485 RepID=A0AAU9QD82_9VIBR|nr:hypothetical protein THF1D04_60163 [Vibrio owensii]
MVGAVMNKLWEAGGLAIASRLWFAGVWSINIKQVAIAKAL